MATQADPSLFARVASTPEQDLYASVLLQAIHDLSSEHERIRSKAISFWFSRSGDWAQSRRLLLSIFGLDEDAVTTRVRELIPDHLMPRVVEPTRKPKPNRAPDPDPLPTAKPAPEPAPVIAWYKSPSEARANILRPHLPSEEFTAFDLHPLVPSMSMGNVRSGIQQLVKEGVVRRVTRPSDRVATYIRTEDLLPLRSAALR